MGKWFGQGMVACAALVLCYGNVCLPGRNSNETRELTAAEAKAFAYEALEGSTARKLPGFYLSRISAQPTWARNFYLFEGLWSNTGEGSVTAGHFAVNRLNGDVWDAVVCERITSPSLERSQQRLRKEFRLTDRKFEALRKLTPGCE